MKRKRATPRRKVHPVQMLRGGSTVALGYDAEPVTDLRQFAWGKPCQVRLPGCDGGGATTVLAHFRLLPYCGSGMKPSDLAFGAWACARCHDVVDVREREISALTFLEIRHAHALGVLRTIAELERMGVLRVKSV